MKTRYLALLSILALFAGCEKDPESLEENSVTFYAIGEPETKTVLVNRNSVYWDRQEEVKVFFKDKDYLFTSNNDKPTLSAKFKGSFGNVTREEGERVMAVYPYSAVSSGNINGATVTLPATQRALTDTFNDDLFLSAAQTTDNIWYFKNICGGVSFTLDRDDIRKIIFRGNDGENLAGTFNFIFSGDGVPVVNSIEKGVKQVTLQAEADYDFAKGHRFYIVLIPQTLKKGYTLDLYSADGLVGTVSSDNPVVIKRATWGVLNNLSTAPDNPPVSLEAVDLGLSVKWANMNLGATKLNEVGNYYSWGETETKEDFSWDNYKWCYFINDVFEKMSKYCFDSDYGTVDNKGTLEKEDDAASVLLGEKWRTPTIFELKELFDNCSSTIETLDGRRVAVFTSNINNNSIIFPFEGFYQNKMNLWSSNVNSTYSLSAWCYEIWPDVFSAETGYGTKARYLNMYIRPVYGDRGTPSLKSTPNTLDFGSVAVGSSASQTVQVTNEGSAGTQVTMNIPEGFSVNPSSGVYLNAKESKTFTITLSPTEAKDYSSYLTFSFDGGVSFLTLSAMGEAAGYAKPEIVDLGLSSKWASFNLGATSPEQTGALFAWGEVESKTYFSWDNYRWGREEAPTKYYNGQGYFGLLPEDDAATQLLGEGWRMPTSNDFWELFAYCSWSKTTKNGVPGFNISRNGKTIFLPSFFENDDLHYWTASVAGNQDSKAHANGWSNEYDKWLSWFDFRCLGNVIRPVYGAGMTSFSLVTYTIPKDFGEVPVGESATQTLRFTNSGNHRTVITYSSRPDGFTCDFVSGTVLEPGTSVEVTFTFTPAKEKSYSGTFKFNEDQKAFNGNNKYIEFTLTGKGVKPADPHPDAIDLGLSVRWADHNVGSTTPEGYGKFYAWGETSSKNTYDWSTYKWGSDMYSLTKYCFLPAYGTNDGKRILEKADDAASANWGSDWRTPTYAEFEELLNNCTWTWTSVNGVKGYQVTSKKNSNSIFLPATGHITDSEPKNVGGTGFYWTAELSGNPAAAAGFYMHSTQKDFMNYMRYFGLAVRPVLDGSTASSAPVRIPFRNNTETEPLGTSRVSRQ